jgi:chemotaxis protein histidine kinase CheA
VFTSEILLELVHSKTSRHFLDIVMYIEWSERKLKTLSKKHLAYFEDQELDELKKDPSVLVSLSHDLLNVFPFLKRDRAQAVLRYLDLLDTLNDTQIINEPTEDIRDSDAYHAPREEPEEKPKLELAREEPEEEPNSEPEEELTEEEPEEKPKLNSEPEEELTEEEPEEKPKLELAREEPEEEPEEFVLEKSKELGFISRTSLEEKRKLLKDYYAKTIETRFLTNLGLQKFAREILDVKRALVYNAKRRDLEKLVQQELGKLARGV